MTEKPKAGEYILIPHYYYVDDEHGNVIYDTDLMTEEFKKELEALTQTEHYTHLSNTEEQE